MSPPARREAVAHLLDQGLSLRQSCGCVGFARSAWYRPLTDWLARDGAVIEALLTLAESQPGRGFWKYHDRLRLDGHPWNHKRVLRVYRQLKLNLPRRTKKRLPGRERMPLHVPAGPNQVWSADFMHDTLYSGKRYRTFNVIDDHHREAVTIEIDSSLTGERLVRVFERIAAERPLPDVLRVDNGPEFLSQVFVDWMKQQGVLIHYIQPGEPNQNAFIERFNRTYRTEVLNRYLFRSLDEVREVTHWWLLDYNEQRPHESLDGLPPLVYLDKNIENSTLGRST